jgi:hypothetical protein
MKRVQKYRIDHKIFLRQEIKFLASIKNLLHEFAMNEYDVKFD